MEMNQTKLSRGAKQYYVTGTPSFDRTKLYMVDATG